MKRFTLFVMMLTTTVSMLFAQNPITGLEDIKPGKIFWLQFSPWLEENGAQASLFWPGEGKYGDRLWSTYVFEAVEDNPEDPRQQFTVVEYEGKLYLYNIAAQKFVAGKDGSAMMMDIPTSYIEAFESTYGHASYPWILAFDGTGAMTSIPANGFEEYGYAYCGWPITDAAPYASCQIYEVGDFADAEALAATLAENMSIGAQQKEEALNELSGLIAKVDEFLTGIGYSCEGGDQIALQVADDDAGNYIWCNEPELSEGPIENLVDGQLTNASFFHSRWNGNAQPKHWLQIDLEEPMQNFSFAYHTRIFDGGSDFPVAIEVQGSNDGKNFTSIASFEKLPQMQDTRWESGDVEADQEYRHLRFVVTASRVYFHMSEFYLYRGFVIEADEAYLSHKTELKQLGDMFNEACDMYNNGTEVKTDDIHAMIEELNALYDLINNLVSGADDPLTIEYVKTVRGLLEIEGVGYPAEAPRAILKAQADAAEAKPTAQARLDLEKAVDEYISTEDIVLPSDGVKYTLTFVTYNGIRNFMNYQDNLLSLVRDTLTTEGLALPETAVFTCEDNGDGTFSFRTADNRYLTTPGGNTPGSGTESGVSDSKTRFTIVKMYPNGKCESDVTYDDLFGLVALSNGGTFMAPNSAGSTFYTGTLPHFMSSWTSAMAIEVYDDGTGIDDVTAENTTDGIYDLMGRKVETPEKGIYIIDGKKVLVK